ncbi:MAG: 23S rRNA (pseudouridine(1915)-N(3))-methyltransferase RlmH [Lachnospiraceae bacterium]|nr:23S rRNA (pseudouridine(1915)-N(3))-methyltransferase RlmH [Lachnospiraceae bacterium]
MMFKIIAVGKIKETFFSEAILEYTKRLSGYTKLSIIQVPDERSDEKTKEKEADSILKQINDTDYVITLEIKGEKLSSEGFAEMIEQLEVSGRSNITFIIGGSLGLSERVSARADRKISFSDMTFPHQLMRVILLEQIYRAVKIIRHEPYHK